jgi:hypothetical protein
VAVVVQAQLVPLVLVLKVEMVEQELLTPLLVQQLLMQAVAVV